MAIIGRFACNSGLAPEEANQRFPDKRSNSSGRPVSRVLLRSGRLVPGFRSVHIPCLPWALGLAGMKS